MQVTYIMIPDFRLVSLAYDPWVFYSNYFAPDKVTGSRRWTSLALRGGNRSYVTMKFVKLAVVLRRARDDRWQSCDGLTGWEENIRSFYPKQSAVEDFAEHVPGFTQKTVWSENCGSGFKSHEAGHMFLHCDARLHFIASKRSESYELTTRYSVSW